MKPNKEDQDVLDCIMDIKINETNNQILECPEITEAQLSSIHKQFEKSEFLQMSAALNLVSENFSLRMAHDVKNYTIDKQARHLEELKQSEANLLRDMQNLQLQLQKYKRIFKILHRAAQDNARLYQMHKKNISISQINPISRHNHTNQLSEHTIKLKSSSQERLNQKLNIEEESTVTHRQINRNYSAEVSPEKLFKSFNEESKQFSPPAIGHFSNACKKETNKYQLLFDEMAEEIEKNKSLFDQGQTQKEKLRHKCKINNNKVYQKKSSENGLFDQQQFVGDIKEKIAIIKSEFYQKKEQTQIGVKKLKDSLMSKVFLCLSGSPSHLDEDNTELHLDVSSEDEGSSRRNNQVMIQNNQKSRNIRPFKKQSPLQHLVPNLRQYSQKEHNIVQQYNFQISRNRAHSDSFKDVLNCSDKNDLYKEIEDIRQASIKQKMIEAESRSNGLLEERGKHLFEEFFVIGVNKNQFNPSNFFAHTVRLQPSTLFSYPNQNHKCQRRKIIHKFVFPFGVRTSRINISDSFNQINEILFSPNNLNENKHNFFMFPLKTDAPNLSTSNANNATLLQACNPSLTLYCVCVKTADYADISSSQDQGDTPTVMSQQHWNQMPHKNCFWKTKKVCVFMTYYPFMILFVQLIQQLLNFIKIRRLTRYSALVASSEAHILTEIDQEFFRQFILEDFTGIVKQLHEIPLPTFNQSIFFPCLNSQKPIQFDIPDAEMCQYLIYQWSASIALSNLTVKDFSFLLLALLNEFSIVFVSKNKALLTATLTLFQNLLNPFQWYHPCVYILPFDLMQLLDSPIPILVGLNKDKRYLGLHTLPQKYPNCIFVCLDEDEETTIFNEQIAVNAICEKQGANLSNMLCNKFTDLQQTQINRSINTEKEQELAQTQKQKQNQVQIQDYDADQVLKKTQVHNESNEQSSNCSREFNLIDNSKNKHIIYHPSEYQNSICMDIIKLVGNFLQNEILQYIPERRVIIEKYGTNVTIDELHKEILQCINNEGQIKKDTKDTIFLQNIMKTQIFSFFLERKFLLP